MKKVFWLLMVFALLFAVAACGSQTEEGTSGEEVNQEQGDNEQQSEGSKEKIELRMTWWGGQERHDRTLQVIEMYEKENPHVSIKPEYSGFDGYFDKLSTQFAAGNAPDIIQYGGNLNDFVGRDVVLPLDDYVGNELDLSKHSQSMIDAATFDGKFYGVTLGTNAVGVLVNKTLFEQANIPLPDQDWTWSEFAGIARQLTENLDGTYGTADFEEDGFGVFLAQRDKVLHENGKPGFDQQDVQDWFQLWQDMRESGAAVPPEIQAGASQTPEQSLIVQGKAAMQMAYSNQYGAYNNATEDELALYIVPYNEETGKNGVSLRPSQFLSGYSDTKHPEEVAKFLDFFVNDPEATAILGNDRGAPVNSDIIKKLKESATETDQVIFSYIDLVNETSDAPYVPNFPGYNETRALYTRVSEEVAFGQATVEGGAEKYYRELTATLEEYANE